MSAVTLVKEVCDSPAHGHSVRNASLRQPGSSENEPYILNGPKWVCLKMSVFFGG